jgi:hypothetical protein
LRQGVLRTPLPPHETFKDGAQLLQLWCLFDDPALPLQRLVKIIIFKDLSCVGEQHMKKTSTLLMRLTRNQENRLDLPPLHQSPSEGRAVFCGLSVALSFSLQQSHSVSEILCAMYRTYVGVDLHSCARRASARMCCCCCCCCCLQTRCA